jgi:hypothetical protein
LLSKSVSRVLSWMDIYLVTLLPMDSSNLGKKLSGSLSASLGGLAPDGVYLADQSLDRWCALTAPLHPYLEPMAQGGLFLWHYP